MALAFIALLTWSFIAVPKASHALLRPVRMQSKPESSIPGGSWVVISGVISPRIWAVTIVTLLRTPLITNHEPPILGRWLD